MNAAPRALVDRLAIWNGVAGLFGQPLELAGSARMVLTEAEMPADQASPRFLLHTVQGDVEVALVSFPFAEATGAEIGMADLAGLPAPLADMLLDGVAQLVQAALPETARRQITGLRPAVGTGAAALPGSLRHLHVSMDGGWGGAPAELVVSAPLACLAGLAADLAPDGRLPALPGPLAAAIPLCCTIVLEGPELPLVELRSLRPGDGLLVLQRSGCACRMIAGHLVVSLAPAADGGWTITEAAVSDHPDHPAETATVAPPSIATTPDEIPVRLSFVIDERTLPLSEVQGLSPGAMLPFAPADACPGLGVEIRANGRSIGAGTLIEIDGQKVVRIARIFGAG